MTDHVRERRLSRQSLSRYGERQVDDYRRRINAAPWWSRLRQAWRVVRGRLDCRWDYPNGATP